MNEHFEALLAHLRLAWRQRKFFRTTNLIEPSFVEERRRTKTLPRFFAEKSCLNLVHTTLIRAPTRWQRISITPMEYEQLKLLYQKLKITPAKEMEVAAWERAGGNSRLTGLLQKRLGTSPLPRASIATKFLVGP